VPEETRKLVVGALDGDAQARGALFDRLRPRLVLWVTTRLSSQLRAKVEPEDVVQEILLAVHGSLDRFDGGDDRAFLRWLFTVAENRIRDLADHFGAAKRREQPLDPREQTTPSQHAARSETARRVQAALERLAEPHRQVIQLRRFEEREVPEIARIMDRSENAVRILYCRALQALKAELGTP
jgi:RNA polymerase sigma-70 factor (ECF subfamily)